APLLLVLRPAGQPQVAERAAVGVPNLVEGLFRVAPLPGIEQGGAAAQGRVGTVRGEPAVRPDQRPLDLRIDFDRAQGVLGEWATDALPRPDLVDMERRRPPATPVAAGRLLTFVRFETERPPRAVAATKVGAFEVTARLWLVVLPVEARAEP